MNISLDGALSSCSSYVHSIKEKFSTSFASLTPLQKKVTLVAAALLSCCAVIYFSYRSWKVKKLDQQDTNLPLKPNPARKDRPALITRSRVASIQRRRGAAPAVIVLPNKGEEIKQEEKKDEKTIGDMLEANRKSARLQQTWDASKGFNIGKQEPIPPRVNDKFIDNRGEEGLGKYSYVKAVGVASCQGVRSTMEDEDLAEHDVFEVNGTRYPFDIFGVFDGHGGRGVSTFVKRNLIAYLKAALANRNREELTDVGIVEALKVCFQNLHHHYRSERKEGAVVIVALLLNGKIWIANAGDARAVLVKNNGEVRQGSEDAKPHFPKFRKSIEKLGGRVLEDEDDRIFRVEGRLAVGRAIGDHHITGKDGQCCISPEPEITSFDLETYSGGTILLACDGLFDVASTDDAGKAVKTMNGWGESAQDMAKRFVYRAIARGSQDNVSSIVIKL